MSLLLIIFFSVFVFSPFSLCILAFFLGGGLNFVLFIILSLLSREKKIYYLPVGLHLYNLNRLFFPSMYTPLYLLKDLTDKIINHFNAWRHQHFFYTYFFLSFFFEGMLCLEAVKEYEERLCMPLAFF